MAWHGVARQGKPRHGIAWQKDFLNNVVVSKLGTAVPCLNTPDKMFAKPSDAVLTLL